MNKKYIFIIKVVVGMLSFEIFCYILTELLYLKFGSFII